MTNQGDLQQSIRDRHAQATDHTFNGDWIELFDQEAVAVGTFNERLLAWLNTELVDVAMDSDAPYATLQAAQNAYATYKGVTRWSDLTDVS